MAVSLTDRERAILAAFVSLAKEDDEGAWACYYIDIARAAIDAGIPTAVVTGQSEAICRDLRRRKLLAGEGRGIHASYWPTDKGRAALAGGS